MMFRFRYLKEGGHTHVRLFAGSSEAALGKCGDFVMRNEEWEVFVELFVSDAGEVQFINEETDHSTLNSR